MKKNILALLAMITFCLSIFAASTDEQLIQDVTVVNIHDLTRKNLDQTMQGKCPEVAIEFPANTLIPFSCFLKGDLLSLVESEKSLSQLEVKQTFYVRCVGKDLLLSSDLNEWKPFLEFITGNISVGLEIQDGEPFFSLGSVTNRRT